MSIEKARRGALVLIRGPTRERETGMFLRVCLRRGVVPCAVFAGLLIAGIASPVAAQAQSAWWKLSATSTPTVLTPGSEARVVVEAGNLGDAPVAGNSAPIEMNVTLPSWLEPTAIVGVAGPTESTGTGGLLGTMTCEPLPALHCSYGESLPAFGTVEMVITVKVATSAPASGTIDEAIEGGETPPVTRTQILKTGPSTPAGVENWEFVPENEGGTVDTQAGSHPFQLTSTIAINQKVEAGSRPPLLPTEPELTKDLRLKLPQGFVGDAYVVPQCSETEFTSNVSGLDMCPRSTAVGVALLTINEPKTLGYTTDAVPVFNLTPARGEPARFGLYFENVPVVLTTSIRTGEDYGVTVNVKNITEVGDLVRSALTLWGVPGDARHAASRGWGCVDEKLFVYDYGAPEEDCTANESTPKALLTLPSSCSGSFQSSAELDTWSHPGAYTSPVEYTLNEGASPLSMTGCEGLPFDPSITATPDRQSGSSPAGFSIDVHVPQEDALTANGVAPADVRDITVSLPEGVDASPAVANGLLACSEEEIQLSNAQEAACPQESKVATAEITTPLLPNPLKGAVYVAAQTANPFGSLLALYLVAKDPVSGVLIKLAGEVTPNATTGQLTATFANTPELPFENATINLFESPRAALSTPSQCQTYTTNSSIVPWSGAATASPSSSFQITSGPGGAACASSPPFAPAFRAGTTSLQAGSFAPFTMELTRPDGDQALGSVSVQLPPGLAADLATVPLCPEPAASEGHCGAASLVGHVSVEAGLGSEPVTVEGGEAFLTGPYEGAPFGLSIVTTAKAGPYNLGVVIVRAAINIDPHTAAVSVTSGSFPTILQGIPLQLKAVRVAIDRSDFTFNPTKCVPTTISGSVKSATGTATPVSNSFDVANCGTLGFKPTFAASTDGLTSKRYGASLDVKLNLPKAPFGSQANIAKVKVDLPIKLPTRLTTLHGACPAEVFAASPLGCPAHSIVGEAQANTPILPVPLTGKAYLVSHGGETFPNLVMVLQGYGITIDLVGTTNIKKGITSNTFNTVPDVPVSSFELKLPESEYSLLAANGNLCATKTLPMPTAFAAQSGLEIHETTAIKVTGCPTHKAKKPAKKKKKAAKKGKGAK
jgi:hypothetical protein